MILWFVSLSLISQILVILAVLVGLFVFAVLIWLLSKLHKHIGGMGLFWIILGPLFLLGYPFRLIGKVFENFGTGVDLSWDKIRVPFVYVVTMHALMFIFPTSRAFFIDVWNEGWELFVGVEILFCFGLYFLYPKSGWARPLIAAFILFIAARDVLPYLDKKLELTAGYREWAQTSTNAGAVYTGTNLQPKTAALPPANIPFSENCGKPNGPMECTGVVQTFGFAKVPTTETSEGLPGEPMDQIEATDMTFDELPESTDIPEERLVYRPGDAWLCWKHQPGDVALWIGNAASDLQKHRPNTCLNEGFKYHGFSGSKTESVEFLISRRGCPQEYSRCTP